MMSDAVKALTSIMPKVRKQLHQSGLEMLSKCGIQFEFRYLKGIKRKPNAFLICGTATDAAVTSDLNHKIETGELEQESVLLDIARDRVENHPEKNEIELEDDETGQSVADVISATKDKAVRLVTAHHARVAPIIQPFATARKFSLNLDRWLRLKAKEIHDQAEKANNRWLEKTQHQQAAYLNAAAREGFDFVGEQDIVEKNDTTLVIRDTKTSKKSPNAEAADQSNQLSAYALASQVLDGKLPDSLKLDYLIDLKKETKTMTLETVRDAEYTQAYLNRLVNGIASIRSGVFVPAPDQAWWCAQKWCAYHGICPHVKHAVTTTASQG
jgi:PD-(D/E)XK nuclease superfamily